MSQRHHPASDDADSRRRRLNDWLVPTPDDPHEAGHVRAMRRLLDSGGDPFRRDHLDPGHFTASAFVLSPDGSSLAMVLHSALQRWLQPGGHVEPEDDDLLAAARREAREELGIDQPAVERAAPIDFDVHSIPARHDLPAHRHFDVRFLLRAADTRLSGGDGVDRVRWVPLHELSALAEEPAIRRLLRKL